MKKTMIAASLLSLLPSLAQAAPEVYGRVWANITDSSEGILYDQAESFNNNMSFIGLKGSEKVGQGTSVVYVMELGVNSLTEDDSDILSKRNAYLGLKSDAYGLVTIGRNDTVFKKSEGKVDVFNMTVADMGNTIAGNDRLGSNITYYSPKMRGVQFGATYIVDGNDGESSESSYALSITSGDTSYKKRPYYSAISYNKNIKSLDAYRFVVGTKLAGVKLGAIYQYSEKSNTDQDGSGYLISAAYPMGKLELLAQYSYDDSGVGKFDKKAVGNLVEGSTRLDSEASQMSIGFNYNFSKSLQAGALINQLDADYTTGTDTTKLTQSFDETLTSFHLKYVF